MLKNDGPPNPSKDQPHEGSWTAGPPTGKINKDQLLERLEVLGIPRDEYEDWQLNVLLNLVNGYTPFSRRVKGVAPITFPEEPTPLQQKYGQVLIPNKRRNDE